MTCPGCGNHKAHTQVVLEIKFYNCRRCGFSTWDLEEWADANLRNSEQA